MKSEKDAGLSKLRLTQSGADVLLPVKVVPKSSRDRIVGELDGALKIAVSAPPEKGAANAAVCRLLAEMIGNRVQQIQVETGHCSPRKMIRILSADVSSVERAVAGALKGRLNQ